MNSQVAVRESEKIKYHLMYLSESRRSSQAMVWRLIAVVELLFQIYQKLIPAY